MTYATLLRACISELGLINELTIHTETAMARHTTFRIGGAADVFAVARSANAVKCCLGIAASYGIPVCVVGKGSNLLVSDEGVRGIVLTLQPSQEGISFHDDEIWVDAALPLGRLVMESAQRGYQNFVHLAGIPGTVGGALAMNAGTGTDYIDSEVISVTAISIKSPYELIDVTRDEIAWDYRFTSLRDHTVILGATFRTGVRSDPTITVGKVTQSISARKAKQPLRLPNAGSVFRNPEGDFAGRLIELVGLKGKRIGDVQFSEQHANFIVNCGGGMATDVVSLIQMAKERVYSQYGTRLQTEIRPIGEISF